MGSEIKVEVTHRETITPSSPTPHHLSTSKLSVFDQFMADIYIQLLLFYPSDINHNDVNDVDHRHSLVTERSKLLKTSLSEALSRFYPFAGRISIQHNNLSINCSDQGAAFIEARVNCSISKILEEIDPEMLKQLLPTGTESRLENTGYLLLVQANFFKCGGVAIGVSLSHKAADASTLSTFINSWAAMALGADVESLPAAEFGIAASVFPQLEYFNNNPLRSIEPAGNYEIRRTRRFVFSASKIALLKSKAASVPVPNPTRVEVVLGLLWKCAIDASRSNLGSVRPSVSFQTVNLRKLLGQPNLMGNLVGVFASKTEESEAINLQTLVAILREGMDEFKVIISNGLSKDALSERYMQYQNLSTKDGINFYHCTSWCRFPFYETDFGWGKPSWVAPPSVDLKQFFNLVDTRDGDGIEAFLNVKEEDMALIETNQELLAYASLNPSAI